MSLQQIDVIVRVSGVTLLLLLALMWLRDDRGSRAALWFLPMAICLSGFLIGNTPDLSLRLTGIVGATAHLLSGYAAVFIWCFCLASFDAAVRPRGPVLIVGLTWFLIASADRGIFGEGLADKGLSWVLVAMGLGMVAHLAWRLLCDRAGDLLEGRRQARVVVVALLAGQLLIELSKEIIFGLNWRPRGFTVAENIAVLVTCLWLITRLPRAHPAPRALAHRGLELWAETAEAPDRDQARLMVRLHALIETERAHLDPEITFADFVQRMGAPERAVRRLINHRLGHDHFRAFLNAHRVAEARRLLADPRRAGEKLIAIAFDSGFASLASFNRVFRALEGRTPTEYRAAAGGMARETAHPSGPDTTFEERSSAF